MQTLKFIYANIPKWIRSIIIAVFIVPILGYIILQIATNEPIDLSSNNLFYLFLFVSFLTFMGMVIGSWRGINSLLSQNPVEYKELILKVLPSDEVAIGTFKTEDLSASIRATIILEENSQPNVDIFLDRIRIGEPYCSHCSRPMDILRGSWMIDGVQIGYKCVKCGIEHKEDRRDVLNSVKGEVRSKYAHYCEVYQKEINLLTEGKQENYRLP